MNCRQGTNGLRIGVVSGLAIAFCFLVCANTFAQSIGYSYDLLNRLTQVAYADGSPHRDAAGNVEQTGENPEVTSLS